MLEYLKSWSKKNIAIVKRRILTHENHEVNLFANWSMDVFWEFNPSTNNLLLEQLE